MQHFYLEILYTLIIYVSCVSLRLVHRIEIHIYIYIYIYIWRVCVCVVHKVNEISVNLKKHEKYRK